MSKKLDDLRKAAATARAAADASPSDQALADAATKAETELAEAEAAGKPKGSVKVRVLVDHRDYAVNEVAELTAEEAAAAVKEGWADDTPAAVAYAESLAS